MNTDITPHYVLNLFVDSDDTTLLNLYKNALEKHNNIVDKYFIDNCTHVDAGFDLFCPEILTIAGGLTQKVNHKVKASMNFINNYNLSIPVGYYLYPRSSTGSKTPLRLANSVGIIDSGYRGHLIGVFDNWSKEDFTIEPYQRLMQVCPPNMTYPIYVRIVDTEEDLGLTIRGSGGFGSSGK
jgi:dUTP pyrophosphatase